MSREPNIDEIQQLYVEWEAKARALRERPPRFVPDEVEIWQLQILMAAAGSPPAFERWLQIARERLKASQGRPAKQDGFWLLCAAALQRRDPTLLDTEAIRKVVERVWQPFYGISGDAMIARLMEKRGQSLAEFAESHPVRVEYTDEPGDRFMMSFRDDLE